MAPDTFAKKYEQVKGTLYQTRAGNVIDASEWTGTNPQRIMKFCPFAQFDANGTMFVQASWGLLEAKRGDFVIRYSADDYGVCDRQVFFDTYEKA